jgi:NAD-dependent dihydropyrimidine dehydrogenase PreA subunit
MKVKRKIIEIDEERCDGCGQCVPSCAEGALAIIDGKARVVADVLCDGLGACMGDCPNGALQIIEREADEFDEVVVEKHLAGQEKIKLKETQPLHSCPSVAIQSFQNMISSQAPDLSAATKTSESALRHWPVQIMLVPPTAPFLKDADLLVVADCVPLAYADFHKDFLAGKAVMMGCPKFDDVQLYIDKFAQIFSAANINSITSVMMEVPCCSKLPMIVKKGMELAEKKIPLQQVIISTRGQLLQS